MADKIKTKTTNGKILQSIINTKIKLIRSQIEEKLNLNYLYVDIKFDGFSWICNVSGNDLFEKHQEKEVHGKNLDELLKEIERFILI